MVHLKPGAEASEAELRHHVAQKLAAFNATQSGSSRKVGRFKILTTPPSLDAGEITDKGYINQGAVLRRRAAEVDALYAATPDSRVIRA